MSPQDRAELFADGRKVENMFAKSTLLCIVDDSLSDFAFRVLTLLAIPRFVKGVAVYDKALSHLEVAAVMSCSERQARRVLIELERKKYIEVDRRHNCRNSYRLSGAPAFIQKEEKPRVKRPLRQCARCHQLSGYLAKTAWCRKCTNAVKYDNDLRRKALELLAEKVTA